MVEESLLRLTGNDHFTIMAISGHRTTSVFRRYNVVTEEELQKVKWKSDEFRGVHIGVHHSGKGVHIGVYKPSHYIAIGSTIDTIIR